MTMTMTPRGPFLIALLAAGMLGACTQFIEADDATYVSLLHMTDAQKDDNFGTEVVLEGEELSWSLRTRRSSIRPPPPRAGAAKSSMRRARAAPSSSTTRRTAGRRPTNCTGPAFGRARAPPLIAYRELPRISMARAGDTVAIGVPGAAVTACDGAGERSSKRARCTYSDAQNGIGASKRSDREHPLAGCSSAPDRTGRRRAFRRSNAATELGDLLWRRRPRNNGGVYVFAREAGSWRETQRIVPNNPIDEAHFGCSLSVDGDTLAVGAWCDSHPERRHPFAARYPEAAGGDGDW